MEILLKPEGQNGYYELHVTPDNHRSQFRFPKAECAAEMMKANPEKATVDVFGVDFPIFDSKTQVMAPQDKWYVLAQIDMAAVIEGDKTRSIRRVFCNFCRKNVFASGAPEYSSTAELSEFNYHHQNEWGTL